MDEAHARGHPVDHDIQEAPDCSTGRSDPHEKEGDFERDVMHGTKVRGMTNVEDQMTKEARMSKHEGTVRMAGDSDFVIRASFDI